MNKLSVTKRAQIIGLLVEGNSLRSTSRLTDCSINTVTKLLIDVGVACAKYQDKTLRNLPCKRLQCDEIWSFVYSKQKNVPEEKRGQFGVGDVWTWTAIDADTTFTRSRCTSCTTTSGASTKRFVSRQLWRRASRITSGLWKR